MSKILDLIGQKYSKLTVLSKAENKNGRSYWLCLCDCGNSKVARASRLKSGDLKSCGCLQNGPKSHGLSGCAESRVWGGIKTRCLNKLDKSYDSYGGKCISICDRWKDSFINFFDDMGARPSNKHTIDRIDNNEGYSPENCRWATHSENCQNKSTSKRWVVDGVTYNTARQAARSHEVDASTIISWCSGRRRSENKPKEGCYSYLVYPSS